MNTQNKCVLLAEKIKTILREGSVLSRELVHYIDSAFSNPSITELEAILGDESDCERDSLLDLIFFPDEALHIRLENFLEKEDFQKKDEEKIRESLFLKESPHTKLRFPDRRGELLNIPMPFWIAEQFISRLNICNKPDEKLTEAINRNVCGKHKIRFRVMLRNSRLVYTANQIRFLCDFFGKMNSETADMQNCLDFALHFLGENRDDTDIFSALTKKKRNCFQHLQKLLGFEEQLEKNNMEILMLRGVRMPYADKETLLRQIAMIDTICLSVFGKTEETGRDLFIGEYHQGKDDIEKMVRMFL
ncbi:MAG: hypothetical protein B6245_12710 [Desulfobacteraceae bacterium 4572_88]|nr:MAG: hypothetical protein B6245_12710 [Desulfobacteraceae bacterium 4572_88]